MRAALIDSATDSVDGIIVVGDGYVPPDGYAVILDPPASVHPGMLYNQGDWSPASRAPIAIEVLREQAHALRRERRTQAELAGFSHAGHPLDSDRDSILRIANAAASAISSIIGQQPWATVWRCADEYNLPLDAPGMLAMQGALALHGQACHTVSQAIGAEVDAAASIAALDALIAILPSDPRWPA
jgi:hypothetical protein